MKRHWLARSGGQQLTLVFGGWGLGVAPFAGIVGAEDVLVMDNYTTLDDPLPETTQYDYIRLLGYSFGVAAAAHWLSAHPLRLQRLVAVNGTLFPADKGRGIPPGAIAATADNLSKASFARFCRRAGHAGRAPGTDIETAQAELRAILQRGNAPQTTFQRIWISGQDQIIPAETQEAAWQAQSGAIRRLHAQHQPFSAGQSWQDWFA